MKHTPASLTLLLLKKFGLGKGLKLGDSLDASHLLEIESGKYGPEPFWIRIFEKVDRQITTCCIEFTQDKDKLNDSLNCKILFRITIESDRLSKSLQATLHIDLVGTSYSSDLSDANLTLLKGNVLRAFGEVLKESSVELSKASSKSF